MERINTVSCSSSEANPARVNWHQAAAAIYGDSHSLPAAAADIVETEVPDSTVSTHDDDEDILQTDYTVRYPSAACNLQQVKTEPRSPAAAARHDSLAARLSAPTSAAGQASSSSASASIPPVSLPTTPQVSLPATSGVSEKSLHAADDSEMIPTLAVAAIPESAPNFHSSAFSECVGEWRDHAGTSNSHSVSLLTENQQGSLLSHGQGESSSSNSNQPSTNPTNETPATQALEELPTAPQAGGSGKVVAGHQSGSEEVNRRRGDTEKLDDRQQDTVCIGIENVKRWRKLKTETGFTLQLDSEFVHWMLNIVERTHKNISLWKRLMKKSANEESEGDGVVEELCVTGEEERESGEDEEKLSDKESSEIGDDMPAGGQQLSAADEEMSATDAQLSATGVEMSATDEQMSAADKQISGADDQMSAADKQMSAMEQVSCKSNSAVQIQRGKNAENPSEKRNCEEDDEKEEKSFSCNDCNLKWRASDKRKYLEHVEGCGRQFSCSVCGKCFRKKSYLDRHCIRIHKKRPKTMVVENGVDRFAGQAEAEYLEYRQESCAEKLRPCSKRNVGSESFAAVGGGCVSRKSHTTGATSDVWRECEACDMKFVNAANYDHHHRTVHQGACYDARQDSVVTDGRTWEHCTRCGLNFASSADYENHIATSHSDVHANGTQDKILVQGGEWNSNSAQLEPEHEMCKGHAETFSTNKPLRKDCENMSRLKKPSIVLVACKTCGRHFRSRAHLNRHSIQHTGSKSHVCKHCGVSFFRKDKLKSHMLVHDGPKKFPCAECDKKFVRLCNLKQHMLSHTKTNNFLCQVCPASFRGISSLRKHATKHAPGYVSLSRGRYRLPCRECGKRFHNVTLLREHMAKHMEARLQQANMFYRCTICNKGFNSQHRMRIHQSMHKEVEKKFNCSICGGAYTTLFNYRNHMEKHMCNGDIDRMPEDTLKQTSASSDIAPPADCSKYYEMTDKICQQFAGTYFVPEEDDDQPPAASFHLPAIQKTSQQHVISYAGPFSAAQTPNQLASPPSREQLEPAVLAPPLLLRQVHIQSVHPPQASYQKQI